MSRWWCAKRVLRIRVQFDIIWKWRTQQLTRHQQARLAQFLSTALARCVRKRMIMARKNYREDKFTHNVLFASCLQLQYQSGQVEIDFLTDQQIAVEIEIHD